MGLFRSALAFLAINLVVKKKHLNIAVKQFREYRCRSCPYFNENITCQKCSCLLDVKWTALTNRVTVMDIEQIELTHCPVGRWNDIDIAEFYNHIKKKKHDSSKS
jgi:hypothetical protein